MVVSGKSILLQLQWGQGSPFRRSLVVFVHGFSLGSAACLLVPGWMNRLTFYILQPALPYLPSSLGIFTIEPTIINAFLLWHFIWLHEQIHLLSKHFTNRFNTDSFVICLGIFTFEFQFQKKQFGSSAHKEAHSLVRSSWSTTVTLQCHISWQSVAPTALLDFHDIFLIQKCH